MVRNRSNFQLLKPVLTQNKGSLLPFVLGSSVMLFGCSAVTPRPGPQVVNNLSRGTFTLSRAIPKSTEPTFVSSEKKVQTPPQSLAFAPALAPKTPNSGIQMELDASALKLLAHRNGQVVVEVPLQAVPDNLPQRQEIIHKQDNWPAWHATDSYFEKRGLPIPPKFSANRFLRGALGELALFISGNTPLHCGTFSGEQVGGIIAKSCESLRTLFNEVRVGTELHVR